MVRLNVTHRTFPIFILVMAVTFSLIFLKVAYTSFYILFSLAERI